MDFEQRIARAAAAVKDSTGPLRIITHIDCDGVAAAAIITRCAEALDRPYEFSRLRELDEKALKAIADQPEQTVIFVDIGSACLDLVATTLAERLVVIIDHHHLQEPRPEKNIFELNPKRFGITERRDISSAGIAYLFAAQILEKSETDPLLALALAGAIGDAQEDQGFIGHNRRFLEKAQEQGVIATTTELQLFGRESRPLFKSLLYSVDIPMQGITNQKAGVERLLKDLRIPEQRDGRAVTFASLSAEERCRLEQALVGKMTPKVRQRSTWNAYTVTSRPRGSPTRDLRELSTLLNACGRLGDIELGVRIGLGDEQAVKRAADQLKRYKQGLGDAKRRLQRHPERFIYHKDLVIIDAEGLVPPDLAGTITSIYTKGRVFDEKVIVCTLARDGDRIKVSMRTLSGVDLLALMREAIATVAGECGGHKNAAGGVFDRSRKEEFITRLKALRE